MRTAVLLLLFALSVPAAARAHGEVEFNGGRVDPPARIGERHVLDQRFAIHTGERGATLLLTRRVVAVQLSERTLRRIDREIDREREEDEGGMLGAIIKRAVLGGVRDLLDHSIECPIREVRDVRYRDGALEILTWDGDRMFEHIQVDDEDLLASFSESDARSFVEEFHRLRGR